MRTNYAILLSRVMLQEAGDAHVAVEHCARLGTPLLAISTGRQRQDAQEERAPQ